MNELRLRLMNKNLQLMSEHIHSNKGAWMAAAAAAVISFLFYVDTVHPGVGPFLDSIEYQTTVAVLGVSHPPGYPLYTFLGKLFSLIPWGEGLAHWGDNPAWRLNMMSVVFSSVTVLLMARLLFRLTRNTVIAFLGALTLAGAVRFWYQASYTELYPLYSTMVTATFLLLVEWMATRKTWLYFASAAMYALSFGVNAPAIMLLPAWLFAVLVTDHRMLTRPRNLAGTAVIVLLAASQYLYIPLRALTYGPPLICNYCPESLSELPAFLSGQEWWGISFGVQRQFWLQRWADSGYQLILQFWPVNIMLAGVGLWHLARKEWRTAVLFVLGLSGTWFFVVSYDVVDWDDFMTPVYLLFVPLIGVGMWAVWEWMKEIVAKWERRYRSLTLGLLVILPFTFLAATFQNNRPLVDQSGQMLWHWWARDLLGQMEDDAWVLTPPLATDGFVQSWALRYVNLTEKQVDGLQMVYLPDLDTPGPAPGYLRWEVAAKEFGNYPVYVLELKDERLSNYGLLPLMRADGWTIGYQIVAEKNEAGVIPWVSASVWNEIVETVIFP